MPPKLPGCPRILACDLDGTLLNGKGVLSEATASALRQAIASGVEVVIATGRRHSFAWQILAPLGLDPETVLISSNGAITRTFGGRLIHRIGLPVATALLLCRQLDAFRDSLVFTFDRTGPGTMVVENIEMLQARLTRWVELNMHEIEAVLPLERAFDRGEEPVQAMICGTLATMRDGLAALDATTAEAEHLRQRISIHRTVYAARDLDFDCGTLLRTTLASHGGRGGGSKDMAQGSVPVEKLAAALDELAAHCQASIAAK